MPKKIILFENEKLSLGEISGVTLKNTQSKTIETSISSRKNKPNNNNSKFIQFNKSKKHWSNNS